MKDTRQGDLLQEAYAALPQPVVTYAEAYRKLVRGEVEHVPVAEMANRIVATGVFPYPPGIPVLAPGEPAGEQDGPILSYLLALQEFDARFPGFGHDIHGVENVNGEYRIYCIKEGTK